jgi:putative ABC transport system permease protein
VRILLREIVHAARLLRRTPGFTFLAATTLALGIGTNAAIFSVVNAVLLTPLPFPDQQQIVQIWDATRTGTVLQLPLSLPKFDLYRGENTTLEYITAYSETDFQTGSGGAAAAEEFHGARVTAGLFKVLGIGPAFGRLFLADEDLPAGAPVAIIGHGLWQRRFASDPEILSHSIEVDGMHRTIVGVMPAGFDFPNESEIWIPKVSEHSAITRRQIEGGAGYLSVLARLKPGVAVEKAATELDTIGRRYSAAHTDNLDAGHGADVVPLREELIHSVRPTLLMLFGAVGLLLLIACSNVANLFLARAAERRSETAIRAALGASRWRLIRQLLTESVLISLAGSALGLLLASWAVSLISTVTAGILPHGSIIQVDMRVVGFAVLLACLTGILFGIASS